MTEYRGCPYRNELEARWAVFFEILGLEAFYEPTKYSPGKDQEAPAFFVTSLGFEDRKFRRQGLYFDVSASTPEKPQLERIRQLRSRTGKPAAIFAGDSFQSGLYLLTGQWQTCAFVQCPLCGLLDLSFPVGIDDEDERAASHASRIARSAPWKDGSPQFYSPLHHCFAECDLAAQYDILSHFNQDYATPARSPILDIAYHFAGSVQFGDSKVASVVAAARQAVQILFEHKIFCRPEQRDRIIRTAEEWAAAKSAEDGQFMKYDEPWYVAHKRNIEENVVPCTCRSCLHDGLQGLEIAQKC